MHAVNFIVDHFPWSNFDLVGSLININIHYVHSQLTIHTQTHRQTNRYINEHERITKVPITRQPNHTTINNLHNFLSFVLSIVDPTISLVSIIFFSIPCVCARQIFEYFDLILITCFFRVHAIDPKPEANNETSRTNAFNNQIQWEQTEKKTSNQIS